MYTTCSELVVFMYWTQNSINNLLSNCGLVNGRISVSETDLPVIEIFSSHKSSIAMGVAELQEIKQM